MTDPVDRTRAAARIIWDNWQAGTVIDRLPDDLAPSTRAGAYAVQAHFEAFSGRPPVGWKIAATSTAGQNHINVSGPIAGRLLAERVFDAKTTLSFGANRMAVAEPEFAFRMGRDFAPRDGGYDQAEVMAGVAALHMGIEVPDSRFADFTAVGDAALIADNACAHEFVLGPAMPDAWRSADLAAHGVSIAVAGGPTHEGRGANVLGDPRIALTWLVNELGRHGITLAAGEVVTTGTAATPIPIRAGDTVSADYGDLGAVQIRFAEA